MSRRPGTVIPDRQLGAEIRLERRPQGAAFVGFSAEKMLTPNNTAAKGLWGAAEGGQWPRSHLLPLPAHHPNLLLIKPKVGLTSAKMPTSGYSLFRTPLQLGCTEPQALPVAHTSPGFKREAADGRVLHAGTVAAWPQPASEARSSSKSIQHLPSVQARLSAVQPQGPGPQCVSGVLWTQLRSRISQALPCLLPPGGILWALQRARAPWCLINSISAHSHQRPSL